MAELEARCLFTDLPLRRYRCECCRAVFGPVQLIECAQEELDRLYSLLYGFYREGFSDPFQEKTFYLLNPSRDGQYLNYACGAWAKGIAHLREQGWSITGFEPFQIVCSSEIETHHDSLVPGQYDGLFSHNFIEHLQHPLRFFFECSTLLKTNGIMAHSTACYEYLYEVAPLHLYFFCHNSARMLAARAGFRFVRRDETDLGRPGKEYICCHYRKVLPGHPCARMPPFGRGK